MLVELCVCWRLGSREDSSWDGTFKMSISMCPGPKQRSGALQSPSAQTAILSMSL